MTQVQKIDHENAQVAHHEENASGGLLGVIQTLAKSGSADVDMMRQLLQMRADEEDRVRRIQREDRDEEAKRAYLRAMSLVQSEIGPILRTKDNEHTRSKYADLADIERIVTPILTKHGFSTTCTPVPCDVPDHIRMRLTIGHMEGYERSYEDDFALDDKGSGGKTNKTPIQAKGSTQSYARRYLKASALDLAFMDDRDGNAPQQIQTVTSDQFIALRDKLAESGMPEETFHKAFGARDPSVARLEEFPARLYEQAMARLNKYIENKVKA